LQAVQELVSEGFLRLVAEATFEKIQIRLYDVTVKALDKQDQLEDIKHALLERARSGQGVVGKGRSDKCAFVIADQAYSEPAAVRILWLQALDELVAQKSLAPDAMDGLVQLYKPRN
jgi:hypothetical protein